MYQAKVNDQFILDINEATTNGWDMIQLQHDTFHLLKDGKSYTAQVLQAHLPTKTFTVKVNTNTYQIALKDQFDLLVERMGLHVAAKKKTNQLKAPMPGLVLDIIATEGQAVRKGDSLLILEAMKMENVLKAEDDATIKAIKVQKGKAVDKNAVLIEFV